MKKAIIILAVILCISAGGCMERIGSLAQDAISMPVSYEDAVVSYLGPEGTYTQEACGQFFHHEGTYVPYASVNEVVDALLRQECDYAVIPQENTIGGAVTDYVDILIDTTGISVAGEVELPISQNLLTLPGANLQEIRTVYSHKQGIAQGSAWLEKNLPDAAVVEVSSTAEGARIVAEDKDPSCAAIASAACAEVYGLDVFAADIQENDSNKTRFYVLSRNKAGTKVEDRLVFIAMGDAEDLPYLMAQMKKWRFTLVSIHDRPMKTKLGEYYYLIETSGGSYERFLKVTEKSEFDFRYLGSFDVH